MKRIENHFWRWIMTYAFALLCVFCYERSGAQIYREKKHLQSKQLEMASEMEKEQHKNKLLRAAIASLDDPAWREIVLIERRNVIPRESIKVFVKS